jgi:hypothetical protein
MASLSGNGVKTQLLSGPKLRKEGGKETGCRRILARIDIAMEIQSYNPHYLSGNPQEVRYRCRKGYHCRSDKICPD